MKFMEGGSFEIAKKYLGKEVKDVIDRPLGSKHPKYGFEYRVNYGYVPDTLAPDREELDAYYLGVDKPLKKAKGKCIAIIHQLDDDDDKLVVVPAEEKSITSEKIRKAVHFQEQYFKSEIIR